jgi:protease-4
MSLFFNLFFAVVVTVAVVLAFQLFGGGDAERLTEHYHSGKKLAKDKIAVVQIDGVLMEGLNGFAQKQIEQAAADPHVKAVVLRINSPGGSISASDDLHRRLRELRDGSPEKKRGGKPLLASMGSLAASGGYYIAMPAQAVVAERTCITGSIGVYAAFPNVAELGEKVGVKMVVIKRGEVKDSGSPFHPMTEHEREVWQDMVDRAYDQFLEVVEEGRPQLKGKLRDPIPAPGSKEPRRRADGGIFTADQALRLGLIDKIGYLDDAVNELRQQAGLGDDCQVITYEKPQTLLGALLGVRAPQPAAELDPGRLAAAATPRLWYLAPQSELAGLLAASGR